jgi:acylphosphatase
VTAERPSAAAGTGVPSRVRVRAVVSGRVQGVWYRESCRREAERLRVAGWIRNNPDGTVELEAEGARPAVEELLAWARQGPPRAVVSAVRVDDLALRGDSGFHVGP